MSSRFKQVMTGFRPLLPKDVPSMSIFDVPPWQKLTVLTCQKLMRFTLQKLTMLVQGYLADKKAPPLSTLQKDYAQGPMQVLGGGGGMGEVPLYAIVHCVCHCF